MIYKLNEKLKILINRSHLSKSSHWKKRLNKNIDQFDEFKDLGFGSYTKKNYKNYVYNFLSKIIFGGDVFKTKTYNEYKAVFDKINRYIDVDTIRHVFTFEKLKKFVDPKSICIIGDGKINSVLGAHLTFPDAIIYSVNLVEVLILDNLILEKTDISLKNSIKLIENKNNKKNKLLNLVPSFNKKFLMNKEIELFINIASFQEMTVREIKEYFEIIKKNKSKLYCCNREYKELIGGEKIHFDKYPFSNAKKIFWEDCPWHQRFYSLKPPFIHNYDGNIKHCLVDFFE